MERKSAAEPWNGATSPGEPKGYQAQPSDASCSYLFVISELLIFSRHSKDDRASSKWLYLCLQRGCVIQSITVNEVCLGIFSSAALAFVVGGANVIYQIERLPIMLAILLHGSILYVSYITVYLTNGWLKWGATPVLVFTGIFVVGYFLILAIIITVTKKRTARLNEILKQKNQGEEAL